MYHGTSAKNGQEEITTCALDNKITLHHLEDALQVTLSNKQSKIAKISEEQNEGNKKENQHSQNTETHSPEELFRFYQSTLNIRSKASLADLKSVVATLESDVTELKNEVSR